MAYTVIWVILLVLLAVWILVLCIRAARLKPAVLPEETAPEMHFDREKAVREPACALFPQTKYLPLNSEASLLGAAIIGWTAIGAFSTIACFPLEGHKA